MRKTSEDEWTLDFVLRVLLQSIYPASCDYTLNAERRASVAIPTTIDGTCFSGLSSTVLLVPHFPIAIRTALSFRLLILLRLLINRMLDSQAPDIQVVANADDDINHKAAVYTNCET